MAFRRKPHFSKHLMASYTTSYATFLGVLFPLRLKTMINNTIIDHGF